ncbi:MAG: methyltransferase domain-containing protein [Halioglobus sp.]
MSNAEQIEYWNGEAGRRWAEHDHVMERLLRPITDALLDHADLTGCTRALDVGCGGGSQTMLLGEKLGGSARILGVDISEPMLQVARGKVAQRQPGQASVEFLQADAASHAFEPGAFDLLFSRFGVMFFDDPVSAFTNLRGALAKGARLAFCCWQGMEKNDWTLLPFKAALQHLPRPEAPPPDAPGPFAFADPQRVKGILEAAGFGDVALTPHTLTLRFGEGLELFESVRELATIGPISRLLAEHQGHPALPDVFAAMERELEPFHRDGAIHLEGAIWLVTGRVA